MTDFEASVSAWGVVYGIAYGLARTEEPCESPESVAARAEQAAWPVFLDYSGPFDAPDRDVLIEELFDAWDEAHQLTFDRHPGEDGVLALTPRLSKVVNQLIRTGAAPPGRRRSWRDRPPLRGKLRLSPVAV